MYRYLSVEIEDVPFGDDQWFLANIKHSGFYRVAYDNETFAQLIEQTVVNPYVGIPQCYTKRTPFTGALRRFRYWNVLNAFKGICALSAKESTS